jgi:hypothetical protein
MKRRLTGEMMRNLRVLDDHELRIVVASPDAIIAEIHQVTRTKRATRYWQQIGRLCGYRYPGDEAFAPHWRLSLFLRSGLEYDAIAMAIISPTMSRADWLSWGGVETQSIPLPPFHPDLAETTLRKLLEEGLCNEPLSISVELCATQTTFERGHLLEPE